VGVPQMFFVPTEWKIFVGTGANRMQTKAFELFSNQRFLGVFIGTNCKKKSCFLLIFFTEK
jgi:hypothetical protein